MAGQAHTLRFWASGGTLLERVSGSIIVERDPYRLRRIAEAWAREALARQDVDLPSAKRLARQADEALMALSVWREQKRAAGHPDPFADERSAA